MDEHERDLETRHITRSAMPTNITSAQVQALRDFLRQAQQAPDTRDDRWPHPPDEVLYDLALGELPAETRANVLSHLADCQECIARLRAFQTAIAADREVYALWQPAVRYAAGGTQAAPIIQMLTTEGKYKLTLQPTADGERDLVTLAVTPSFRQTLEGVKIMVVSSKGTVVLQGTIAGGDLTRLISRRLRDEWPFRIQAG